MIYNSPVIFHQALLDKKLPHILWGYFSPSFGRAEVATSTLSE